MPQDTIEAFLEKVIADIDLFDEGIVKEEITARMERIFTEMFRCALDELRQVRIELMKHETEKGTEGNYCAGGTSSAIRNSSPETVGYAKPTKEIEQRFSD